jgi:hypothetical protein
LNSFFSITQQICHFSQFWKTSPSREAFPLNACVATLRAGPTQPGKAQKALSKIALHADEKLTEIRRHFFRYFFEKVLIS